MHKKPKNKNNTNTFTLAPFFKVGFCFLSPSFFQIPHPLSLKGAKKQPSKNSPLRGGDSAISRVGVIKNLHLRS